MFIHENSFENIVCEMAAIFFPWGDESTLLYSGVKTCLSAGVRQFFDADIKWNIKGQHWRIFISYVE